MSLCELHSTLAHNKRMQPDFGELALPSAADARRYVMYDKTP
jgi:hypothetical protein